MTEQELIDFGFSKVTITNAESDNGYDYYYYSLDLMEGLTLMSSESDNVKNDNWEVINYDWPQKHSLDKETILYLKTMGESLNI